MGLNRSSYIVGVSCLLGGSEVFRLKYTVQEATLTALWLFRQVVTVMGCIQRFGWTRPGATASHTQVSKQGVLLMSQMYAVS